MACVSNVCNMRLGNDLLDLTYENEGQMFCPKVSCCCAFSLCFVSANFNFFDLFYQNTEPYIHGRRMSVMEPDA